MVFCPSGARSQSELSLPSADLVIVFLSPPKSKSFLSCVGAVLRITWACQPIRLHAWLLRSLVTSFLSQEPKAQEKASSAHWENLGRALARWIQHPEAIQHCLSIVFTQSVQFSSNASNFLHFRPNFSFFYLIFLWTFVKIFPLDSFVNFSNAILCFLTGLFSQTYGLFGGVGVLLDCHLFHVSTLLFLTAVSRTLIRSNSKEEGFICHIV